MWRTILGARRFSRPGSMTGVWTVERYMETSESLEQKGTPEGSTLLVAVSPANHIVTQDQEKGPKIPEICGPTHGMSFGWWDPSGSCLRTYQASFLEMMDGKALGSVYLESFPNWGLMQGGEFIAQPMQEPHTSENGGGSWPTPTATERNGRPRPHDGGDLQAAALWPTPVGDGDRTTNYQQGGTSLGFAARNPEMWPTPQAMDSITRSNESFHRIMDRPRQGTMLPKLADIIHVEPTHHIPTPTTADVYTGNMKSTQQSDGSMHSVSLPDYVEMFPTPSTMDHIERKGMRPSRAATNRTTGYLSEEVARWATPTGEDAKNTGNESREKRHGPMLNLQVTKWPTPHASCSKGAGTQGREGDNNLQTATSLDPESIGGSLNPDWVEQHLMSLPEGWTRLEPVPDGAYDEWFDAMQDGTWWDTERGLPRVTTGAENRVNRLKMLGNGIVPATLSLFLTNGKRGEEIQQWQS
mgnify:CR=1 FL=1